MTFPSAKWDVYGFCLKGFINNWPKSVQAYAVVEDPQNIPIDIPDNVTIIDFDEACGERQAAFEERNKHRGIMDMGTTGNIATQAAKFARKAHAQLHILNTVDADVVWYVDADLYTHKPVTMELLETLSEGEHLIGATPRWWKKGIPIETALKMKQLGKGYTETGLMSWNKSHPQFEKWIALYAEMYDNDLIFEYDAWHDCVSFDKATIQCIVEDDAGVCDFGYGIRSSHPLVSGPLGAYFDHLKGQRKFQGFSKERIRVHGK